MEKNDSRFSILLVSTLSEISSYGIRSLASLLQNKNINTDILFTRSTTRFDNALRKRSYHILNKSFEAEFLSFIKPYQIIGFTVYTDSLPECIRLSKLIRHNYPGKNIVYGGIHASIAPQECLQFADYVCVGDGFISFPSFILLQKILFEEKTIQTQRENSDLPQGIWGKDNRGEILRNGCGLVQHELDSLPYPLYSSKYVFMRNYKNRIVPLDRAEYERSLGYSYFTMMSIGCPYSCTYCCNSFLKGLHKDYARVRWHSPEYIVKEILKAREEYEFYSAWFMDDAFIAMSEEYFERFLLEYGKKIGLPFTISGIIPTIAMRYKGRIEKLIKIGMVRGRIGVQTGSKRLLEVYGRRQTNEEVIATSKIFAEYKSKRARASYDVITDGVDESPRDILDTIELLNELYRPVAINLFSLRFYPGTELSKMTGFTYDPNNGYLNYRPTLGNLLIGLINFLRIPQFILRRLEENEKLLLLRIPSFISRTLDLAVLSKRVWSHFYTRSYGRVPAQSTKFIKLDAFIRKQCKQKI